MQNKDKGVADWNTYLNNAYADFLKDKKLIPLTNSLASFYKDTSSSLKDQNISSITIMVNFFKEFKFQDGVDIDQQYNITEKIQFFLSKLKKSNLKIDKLDDAIANFANIARQIEAKRKQQIDLELYNEENEAAVQRGIRTYQPPINLFPNHELNEAFNNYLANYPHNNRNSSASQIAKNRSSNDSLNNSQFSNSSVFNSKVQTRDYQSKYITLEKAIDNSLSTIKEFNYDPLPNSANETIAPIKFNNDEYKNIFLNDLATNQQPKIKDQPNIVFSEVLSETEANIICIINNKTLNISMDQLLALGDAAEEFCKKIENNEVKYNSQEELDKAIVVACLPQELNNHSFGNKN